LASDIAFLCSSDLGLRIFCFVSSDLAIPFVLPINALDNFALCSSDLGPVLFPFSLADALAARSALCSEVTSLSEKWKSRFLRRFQIIFDYGINKLTVSNIDLIRFLKTYPTTHKPNQSKNFFF